VLPRRLHHHRTRHHQDFLVRQRDRLPGTDRRQDGVEPRRPGRRAQHDVGVGVGGHGNEAIAACLGFRRLRGRSPPQFPSDIRERLWRGHRDSRRAVPLDLIGEARDIAAGRQRNHLEPIGMRVHDRQCALADRAGRSEDGNPFHQTCR
jgi:hypothetical protein